MIEIIYRYDPDVALEPHAPRDAEGAKTFLEAGNREFAELIDPGADTRAHQQRVLQVDPRDFGWSEAPGLPPLHAPFAAVLACSDARVPTELVFRQGCNDLFVVRVAGNVIGTECLGSLRYASHHFADTMKLIVVLAHAGCGAVTAAVDAYLKPGVYLDLATDFPLRTIVDRLMVAVRGSALGLEDSYGPGVVTRPGYRAALVHASVVNNAAWTALSLSREFTGHGHGRGEAGVVFGVYDLASRRVGLPVATNGGYAFGLFAPPRSLEDFRDLIQRVARSDEIKTLLDA
jgi:carbonic anhydrase